MKENWNISVQFSPQMRTDGEMVRVTITQKRGHDEEQILLTEEQARSLVLAINTRLSPSAASREQQPKGDSNVG